MVGIVRERLAQDRHRDVDASVELDDGIVRPENLPYFLARDDFAFPLQQDSQNLERLLAQKDPGGPACGSLGSDREKLPGSEVELEVSEPNLLRLMSRSIHGFSLNSLASSRPDCRLTPSVAGK
jgi:hypothetical protein